MNFQLKKLSTVLLVTDLSKAILFYVDQLGFELEFEYEDFYAGLIKNNFSIHLKTDYTKSQRNTIKDHIDMMMEVENIDQIFGQLSTEGMVITQQLRQMPYGKEFYLADPSGNIIAFVEI